jgi:hypothetical protein
MESLGQMDLKSSILKLKMLLLQKFGMLIGGVQL